MGEAACVKNWFELADVRVTAISRIHRGRSNDGNFLRCINESGGATGFWVAVSPCHLIQCVHRSDTI